MADDSAERTEPPSEKRRREFRERGEVARSRDIVSVLVFFCALLYFTGLGRWIFEGLGRVMVTHLDLRQTGDLTLRTLADVGMTVLERAGMLLAPLVAAIVVVSVLANLAQVGFLFTTKTLEPDLTRLNFFSRFLGTFFSKQALGQLFGSLAKIGVVVVVIWLTLAGEGPRIRSLPAMPLGPAIDYVLERCLVVLFNVALVSILVAIADFAWNRWVLEEKMKMTRQEVKDEAKEYEGNPHVKQKIVRRAREIANQRMMQAVPHADVVVNNPTHLSVALRYRQGVDAAPVVVAKGADEVALRIRAIARTYDVPMVQNVPLARVLYKHVKVGKPVPSRLYRAVAKVLAYVYRLRQQKPWLEQRRRRKLAAEARQRGAARSGVGGIR